MQPWQIQTAEHYGCAVLPARPRRPRNKVKVETGVLIAQRWILTDAICDRLLHNAYKIELRGDSMRQDESESTPSLVTNQKNAKGWNLADDINLS